MHVGDTIFIFCLALIIFGPKKLPEIGRQIGKLMVEFRRASNEFKMQIEEELRASDESERQKEITAAAAATSSTTTHSIFPDTSSSETGIPVIAPPATGLPVNHTFASAENGASTAQESEMRSTSSGEEAYPEPETEFNPGLNTASNSEAVEGPVEIAGLQNGLTLASEEMEVGKVQAPLQHG